MRKKSKSSFKLRSPLSRMATKRQRFCWRNARFAVSILRRDQGCLATLMRVNGAWNRLAGRQKTAKIEASRIELVKKICRRCRIKVPRNLAASGRVFCGGSRCVTSKCKNCGKTIPKKRKAKLARENLLCCGLVCASGPLRKIPPRRAPSKQSRPGLVQN